MRKKKSTTFKAMLVGALLVIILVSIGTLSGIVRWFPAPPPAVDGGGEVPSSIVDKADPDEDKPPSSGDGVESDTKPAGAEGAVIDNN